LRFQQEDPCEGSGFAIRSVLPQKCSTPPKLLGDSPPCLIF
jgi:hypothetical protein